MKKVKETALDKPVIGAIPAKMILLGKPQSLSATFGDSVYLGLHDPLAIDDAAIDLAAPDAITLDALPGVSQMPALAQVSPSKPSTPQARRQGRTFQTLGKNFSDRAAGDSNDKAVTRTWQALNNEIPRGISRETGSAARYDTDIRHHNGFRSHDTGLASARDPLLRNSRAAEGRDAKRYSGHEPPFEDRRPEAPENNERLLRAHALAMVSDMRMALDDDDITYDAGKYYSAVKTRWSASDFREIRDLAGEFDSRILGPFMSKSRSDKAADRNFQTAYFTAILRALAYWPYETPLPRKGSALDSQALYNFGATLENASLSIAAKLESPKDQPAFIVQLMSRLQQRIATGAKDYADLYQELMIRLSPNAHDLIIHGLAYSKVPLEHPFSVLAASGLYMLETIRFGAVYDDAVFSQLGALIEAYNQGLSKRTEKTSLFSIPWLLSYDVAGSFKTDELWEYRQLIAAVEKFPKESRYDFIAFQLLQLYYHGQGEEFDTDVAAELLRMAFAALDEQPGDPYTRRLRDSVSITLSFFNSPEIRRIVARHDPQAVAGWMEDFWKRESSNPLLIPSIPDLGFLSFGFVLNKFHFPRPIDQILLNPADPKNKQYILKIYKVRQGIFLVSDEMKEIRRRFVQAIRRVRQYRPRP